MKVDLFDFELPPERIAHEPARPRDSARLLRVGEQLSDLTIGDLPKLLRSRDILVFNDSKVIPARLFAELEGKQVEILLHRRDRDGTWSAFARPGKRLKPGLKLEFAPGFIATVLDKLIDGQVVLEFADDGNALKEKLKRHGHVPLPPYIDRADTADDLRDYQTIYARHEGSVAAPTAGLHFTSALLEKLRHHGVSMAFVTLHVGAGTFQPVKAEDTDEHRMHLEWAEISAEAADAINDARFEGGRVIAVGTTALRTLETASDEYGTIKPYEGDTDLFITPGYEFKAVDALLTNFHLPRSTLFMLTCAFAGTERMKAAYAHAIAHNYRFYSYGDACFLEHAE